MITKLLSACGIAVSLFLCACDGQSKNLPPLKVEAPLKTAPKLTFTKGVRTLFEDSKGRMWFGSNEEGACCFDGKTYTYFTVAQGLPSNSILAIQEDKSGNIWFNGQSYYDGKSVVTLRETGKWNALMDKSQRTPSSCAWSLGNDATWFSLPNDGVLRYDGKLDYLAFPIPEKDSTYYQEKIFLPYFVMTHLKDGHGNMWFGTQSRGVLCYDGREITYMNPDNFGENGVRCIFEDKTGRLWFGSNGGGLFGFDGKTAKRFIKEEQNLSRVWAINQDEQGGLWFGTPDNGVWCFDGKNMTQYTTQNGLPENSATCIVKDGKGKLWFVGASGRVYTYCEGRFEVFY